MLAGNTTGRPPVIHCARRQHVARSSNSASVNTWLSGPSGSNVVWVNFKSRTIGPVARVDHAREAAEHLAGLALQSLMDELDGFGQLTHGWDGPGSVPPFRSAIRAAREFIRSLGVWARLPEISLADDGEISIHWIDEKSYVDVSFQGDVRVAVYASISGTTYKLKVAEPLKFSLPAPVEAHLRPF
jgi:hypothetical protein